MSMKAQSSFKLTEANEIPYSEVGEGSKLTRGYFEVEYNGELQGKGDLQELKCYLPDDSATVYGFERITGRIGDKSGSFVLEHVGKFENGLLKSKRNVVQGSGTGELTGIVGEINFESGSAEEFQITFNYYFE
ncbi:DUF3224 domain-containing protein [Salicibibacter kimchii]|uniref:DUF3224 domain-containing protein n=1 Tax=Salicibibacter kimchii TaxID=2099786 RepID=A0A345C2E4_9BACI|nr:DUF3224 domain-containing protein [Salicibibacter kimchii]AXF57375.1 DUF3224 domain-containing protein [Salicibibacter kimchii]